MNLAAARAAINFMTEKNGFKLWEREYAVGVFESAGRMSVELLGIGEAEYVGFDPQDVVAKARAAKANKVYLTHNHPKKGNSPSIVDIRATSRLNTVLKSVGIILEDHFIIAEKIVSMRDLGYMEVNYV